MNINSLIRPSQTSINRLRNVLEEWVREEQALFDKHGPCLSDSVRGKRLKDIAALRQVVCYFK
jgi:hypothetical protein